MVPKTIILIADTALELIPKEIQKEPIIIKFAKNKGKPPSEIILDSTYHFSVMEKLKEFKKRGRPDILHICLLNILGTPLVKNHPDKIKIFIHTYTDKIIEINPITRIPKHYLRFVGLIEKMFVKKVISSNGKILMNLHENLTLEQIFENSKINNCFIFTSKGVQTDMINLFKENSEKDLILVVGGFPHGNFSEKILALSSNHFSICTYSLEAWIVVSRILFAREITL